MLRQSDEEGGGPCTAAVPGRVGDGRRALVRCGRLHALMPHLVRLGCRPMESKHAHCHARPCSSPHLR